MAVLWKADEPVGAADQVADHREAGKHGGVIHRNSMPMRPIGTPVEFQSPAFEALKIRPGDAPDRLVDAVEIDIASGVDGGFRQANALCEGRCLG